METVFDNIVPNKICVGCGVCAGMLPNAIQMHTNEYGEYRPKLTNTHKGPLELDMKVCPFSNESMNEDTLAKEKFSYTSNIQHRSETGYFLECFAGHVVDENYRYNSTSGGILSWVAIQMLETGMVQAVACVGPSEGDALFDYKLVTDVEILKTCRKSRYYPIEASKILQEVRAFEGKVLFIGLPCFIKSVLNACKQDSVLKEKVEYTMGLFCGHLKSKHYTEYLARNCNVEKQNIKTVNFRKKIEGNYANDYAFEAETSQGGTAQVRMKDVWASSWSNNLFMQKACEYCDDVMAETADIAVGDAWIPGYTDSHLGNSIVVCRTPAILNLLHNGIKDKVLNIDKVSIQQVIASQAGGLRQRRDALEYRLYLDDKVKRWRPNKRVQANNKSLSVLDKLLQKLRIRIRAKSMQIFLQQRNLEGLTYFKNKLWFLVTICKWVVFLRKLPQKVIAKITAVRYKLLKK